ncbi:MAG: hypothetical protein ACOH2H_25555 [Cypionkella sp.]
MTPIPKTNTARATQPRRWKSLVVASVTLAASPAMADVHRPAPVTLVTPQTRIWLAQAQGGEGGEAGVTSDATPDATYLTELMIIEGHMLAARDLYTMNQRDKAVELAKHPQEEGTLDTLRKDIASHKAADPAEAIDGFVATMEKGASQAEVDTALTAVSLAFAGAAAVEADQVRARFDAVVLLLKAAAAEYQGSQKDGVVEDVMAWHEARSFVGIARARMQELAALTLSAKAAPKALAAMQEADTAFGDPSAAAPLAGDAQILLGVAARVELIASSVR